MAGPWAPPHPGRVLEKAGQLTAFTVDAWPLKTSSRLPR